MAEIICLEIDKVLLFEVISDKKKDEKGIEGISPDSIICRAVRAIRKQFPQIIFTDICFCEYISHGHFGLICNSGIDNGMTLPLLAEMDQHAVAGTNFVTPLVMVDGRLVSIFQRLKKEELFTKILVYSVKYACSFCGSFHNAAGSFPSFCNKKIYQMDFRTIEQRLDEIASDIKEGVDWIMIKPTMPYLEVQRVSICFQYLLVAYQVSGEYAMLIQGAKEDFFEEKQIFFESLIAIKRAGAKYIISYYAKEFANE